MKFSQIPGLQTTSRLIVDAVRNDHLAHAQMFAGAEGSLALPLALATAAYIHCEQRGEDACGVCAACVKSMKYIHPDTHFVVPLIKSDKDVDDDLRNSTLKLWRSFLIESPFGVPDDWATIVSEGEDKKNLLIPTSESRHIVKTLSLKSFESRYKVMILWQPELLHPNAANGILKILEEPPPQTYFILVSYAADQLLPTILSRTQILPVPLLDDVTIANYLKEHHQLDDAAAKRLALLADGNLAQAIHLTEGDDEDHFDEFVQWMEACANADVGTLVGMADNFHGLDKVRQRNRLSFAMSMMRETLLELYEARDIQRAQPAHLDFVRRFAPLTSLNVVQTAYDLLNEGLMHLERNGSAKMIYLDLSLGISGALRQDRKATV
ncbi:MAG TPA: DNA polymerase III subunit delta [Cyclobacteriaceae bacterium]|jgi:DNA polymerase-3 subunit delta'